MKPKDLKRIRQKLGLTQKGLAERLGVTLVTVGRWEAGMRRITEPMARLIERIAAEERKKKGRKEELEDRLDVEAAKKALAESDERIPYEDVRKALGLA
jgi:transcriptional regulator with XRE-family HTH domain